MPDQDGGKLTRVDSDTFARVLYQQILYRGHELHIKDQTIEIIETKFRHSVSSLLTAERKRVLEMAAKEAELVIDREGFDTDGAWSGIMSSIPFSIRALLSRLEVEGKI